MGSGIMTFRPPIAVRVEIVYSRRMSEIHPICARIREARTARGLKTIEMSIALRTHPSMVSHWERDKVPVTLRAIEIAELLDVSLDWLLTGEGRGPRARRRVA